MTSVHSDLEEEIQRRMDQAIFRLKSQIMIEVDKKVTLLEALMEIKHNEVRQELIPP